MKLLSSYSNTCPILAHSPDADHSKWWPQIIKRFLRPNPQRKPDELAILTWNNKDKGVFETSLDLAGINYTVKGTGIQKWSNYYKFALNLEFLEETSCPYVMGCDSHDVILLGGAEGLVERFKKKNCKLLFNCERFFHPGVNEILPQKWKRYQEKVGVGRYRFLNSGMWIGEREFCKKFFAATDKVRIHELFDCSQYHFLCKDSNGCDQSSVHCLFEQFYPDVQLDYGCDLFFNIARIDATDMQIMVEML